MIKWLFPTLLVAAISFIGLKGRRDERVGVALVTTSSVITFILFKVERQTFDVVRPAYILNDAAILAAMLIIAFRSHRFWPLPVASFQLATVLALLAPLFGKNLVSYALGVTQGLWAYLQLLTLVLAVVRGRNRRHRQAMLQQSSPV